jgi:hypothetical protein
VRTILSNIHQAAHLRCLSVGKIPLNFELPLDLNITPGTFQPVIRNGKGTAEREIALMRLGMTAPLAESLTDVNTSAESFLSVERGGLHSWAPLPGSGRRILLVEEAPS